MAGMIMMVIFYPMPHAGQLPVLFCVSVFCLGVFFVASAAGFSQELMVPAVTATSMAVRSVLGSFIFF
jgi:hypothetical protein